MAKRALLAGINRYKSISGLRGCVNDVINIKRLLTDFFQFDSNDIRILLDERATKDAILRRLDWLANVSKDGDTVVFHFSGHGSQIADLSGDEPDRLDELICPWDMDWAGVYITDDDLRLYLSRFSPGVRVEVILDCCHSGTGTRDLPSQADPHPVLEFSDRFTPPPPGLSATRLPESFTTNVNKMSSGGDNQVLWAGSQSNQTSADAYIRGSYNGAFTYFMCGHIARVVGRINRNDLLGRVQSALSSVGFSQVPQLSCESECDYNTVVFGAPKLNCAQ